MPSCRVACTRRKWLPVWSGLLVVSVLLTGCSSATGLRDDGPASPVHLSATASPLWPDHSPAPSPDRHSGVMQHEYAPVPGFTVPAGELKNVSPSQLLKADPAVSDTVKIDLGDCAGPGGCLRSPVYTDLTGDGRPELVLAVDSPVRTCLLVYTASGDSARLILESVGQPGLTASTVGRDLVIERTGTSRITTRYRWNGKVLEPVSTDSSNPVRAR